MNADARKTVVLAGGSGDLGGRIAGALLERGAEVRAIVRSRTSPAKRAELLALGVAVLVVDEEDSVALADACRGASCVVSG